jgi:hypothetical protein
VSIGVLASAAAMAPVIACSAFGEDDEAPIAEAGVDVMDGGEEAAVTLDATPIDGGVRPRCPTPVLADDFERATAAIKGNWDNVSVGEARFTIDPGSGPDGKSALHASSVGFTTGSHHAFLARDLPGSGTFSFCLELALRVAYIAPQNANIIGPRVLGYGDPTAFGMGVYHGFHINAVSGDRRIELVLSQESRATCPNGLTCSSTRAVLVPQLVVGKWYAITVKSSADDRGAPRLIVAVDDEVFDLPFSTGLSGMPSRVLRMGMTAYGEGELFIDDVRLTE